VDRDFVGRSWSLTAEFTIGGRLDGDLIVERARPWLVAVKEGARPRLAIKTVQGV